ncbi:MAG: caspase family protein [Chitinophagaceae bacterium]
MVNLEIEILSAEAKEDIYQLRNYLAEQIDNLQISIKEQSALEGQMSPFTSEGILNGVIHAGVGIGIEQCVHIILPVIKDFLKHIPLPFGKKVEVLATLGDGAGRVTISEDSEGVSKRYDNVTYSIDTGHTRAILIGSGEFDYDFLPIPPVKGNVEDFYKLLIDKRNIGLPAENITVALNKTNTEIEEILLRVSKLPDTETLLIYFSGHGYRSDVTKLHLIARNTRKIDDYISGGIDYDFIKNVVLKSSPAKQKIVILDACHSGIATQGANDAILDVNVMGTYVMASSESDEVSYYDKNKRNTFFTGSLLDTLTNGVDNAKEMLALNDLYENAKSHLDQRQQPRFKDKLNISPSDFFIARNPSFSLEKNIQYATQLYKTGNLSEALREFRKILKRQPGNQEVKNLAEQCNDDLLFTQFMKQGDEYFYQQHQYQKALDNYQQAYEIRPDVMTAEKIRNSKASLQEGKMVGPPVPVKHEKKHEPAPVVEPIKKKETKKEEDGEAEEKEKKGLPAKILVLIIGVGVALLGWLVLVLVNGHEGKTNFTELRVLLDSVPGEALGRLRQAKEKDSAYYIIGNYFREDKKPDSAVYYYNKAIEVSNLPVAYSSLASLYDNYEIHDSTKMRSAYDILKKADSLFKADTTAYFMLGKITEQKAIVTAITNAGDNARLLDEAERWYLKGYKKGSKLCGVRLGIFYLGARENPAAAFPYLKEAAQNNTVMAQLYVSDMYYHGNGAEVNKEEGDKWFKLFIKNANTNELTQAAKMYAGTGNSIYRGYGVDKDCLRAMSLFNTAESKITAIHDSYERSNTYVDLGNFYYDASSGCAGVIKPDHKKAKEYYMKAADLGNVMAMMYLNDSTMIH